jgi:flagellar biosynthesis/type III secretory pathway protein FliH
LQAGLNAGLDAGLADKLAAGLRDGVAAGLREGLDAGFREGLREGLDQGLRDGFREGLREGLDAGLRIGLADKLAAGLRDGLTAGLHDRLAAGLDDGLDVELWEGLRDGLEAGLRDGLDAGLRDGLGVGVRVALDEGLIDEVREGLRVGLRDGLREALEAGLNNGLRDEVRDGLRAAFAAKLKQKLDGLRPEYCGIWWSWWLARYLIAKSWGVDLNMEKLSLLWGYCIHAPLVATNSQGDVIIVPKPTKISWVETGLTDGKIPLPIYELHNDGAPAVEHPLCNLYYWHNTKLPEYIGSVHSSKWKSEWVLKETNTEIRKILIEQIGYDKLCQDLEARKLDAWREYELLRIDDADIEPMHLLKMTCPSTGHIHVLRVPPDQTSARKAIKWCNWGIDADEFVVET